MRDAERRPTRRSTLLSLTVVATLGVPLLASTRAWSAQEADSKAALAALKNYIDSLSTKDGQTASKLVSAGSLAFYEKMRVAALEAPAKEVREMTFTRLIFVLLLRIYLEPQQLRDMDGRQLFATAVQRGWIEASLVARASIGKVSVRGDFAVAKLAFDEKNVTDWTLVRENGAWKNDLLPIMKLADLTVAQQLKAVGKQPTDLAQDSIEALIGKKMPASAWDPPGAAAPRKK